MENVLYFNRATVPLREPHLLTYIDYASHIIRLREPHSLPAINAFFMYPFIKLQKSEKKNLISDSVGRFRTFSRISKFKKWCYSRVRVGSKKITKFFDFGKKWLDDEGTVQYTLLEFLFCCDVVFSIIILFSGVVERCLLYFFFFFS